MKPEEKGQGALAVDGACEEALFDLSVMLMEDLAAGEVNPVEHYQSRFPGFEEQVAAEYNVICNVSSKEQAGVDMMAPDARYLGDLRIGNYLVEHELGRGGQATVYSAKDLRMERSVALKVLSTTFGNVPPSTMERFRREASSVANIDHPCICDVFEADFESDPPYIAMRLVKGESLRQHIQRAMLLEVGELEGERDSALPCYPRGEAELLTLLRVFERLARALHAAHEENVIHRDIKPANLILDEVGTPVILDFGLARVGGEDSSTLTMTGEIFGTPAYMPPELLRGQVTDPGPSLDVYALAVTLYECLTLKRPFDAATPERVYQQILEEEAPSVQHYHPELPDEVAVVLATALEKDLNRRYATALDLAEELRRICEREPIHAVPAGLGLRLKRWYQRHPALGTSIAGSILILIIGLTISLFLLDKVANERDQKEELLVEVGRERDQKEQVLEIYKGTYYRENARIKQESDPLHALLLATEAYRKEPIELNHREVRYAMSQVFDVERTEVPFQNFEAGSGFISDRVMDPNGGQFIYVDRTDNLWTYDYESGDSVRVIAGPISDDLGDDEKNELAEEMSPSLRVSMDPEGEHLFLTRGGGEVIEIRTPDAERVRGQLSAEEGRLYLMPPRSDLALTLAPPPPGAGQREGPARLWEIPSGELISEVSFEGMWVLDAALSPTHELAAVALHPSDRESIEPARLELWNMSDGSFVTQVGDPEITKLVAWGPEGDRLYVGSLYVGEETGGVYAWRSRLWRMPEVELVAVLEHEEPADEVSFSADGARIAVSCSRDGLVKVWDGRTGEEQHELYGHEARDFIGLHFSPTNSDLLATTNIDRTTRVWDLKEGVERNLFLGMTSPPSFGEAAWDGDNYYLLSEKGVLHGWRTGESSWPKKLRSQGDEVYQAWVDSDNETVTMGLREGGVERVSWRTGEVLASHQWAAGAVEVALSHESRGVVAGISRPAGGLEVYEWSWETGEERLVAATDVPVLGIDPASPGSSRHLLALPDQVFEVWDFDTADRLFFIVPSEESASWVISQWIRDGALLITGAADGYIRFWDGHTGELTQEFGPFEAHNGDMQVIAMLLAPDERSLYVAYRDARIRQWDLETGALMVERASHTFSSLKLLGDEYLFGSALYNGKHVLFELDQELTPKSQLNLGTRPAKWISVSKDQRHVAISDAISPAALLDTAWLKRGLSKEEQYLSSELRERALVGAFSPSADPAAELEGSFDFVDFFPDGEHLFTVYDGAVWIWPTDLVAASEAMSPVEIDFFGGFPSPKLVGPK